MVILILFYLALQLLSKYLIKNLVNIPKYKKDALCIQIIQGKIHHQH